MCLTLNGNKVFWFDVVLLTSAFRFTNRVICHELTHHFFGNHVRIEDWGNLWLKEGFATLLPILWAYETGGTEYGDLFLLTQVPFVFLESHVSLFFSL
jgi:aminopeptidase N